jgi:hypothetical protein
MRIFRRQDRRPTERGSAAVEMIFSVPFLFLFAVAMLHSVKIFRGQIKTQVAARHYAWSEGRAHDFVLGGVLPQDDSTMYPAQPRATSKDAFVALHFGQSTAAVSRAVSHEKTQLVSMTVDAASGKVGEGGIVTTTDPKSAAEPGDGSGPDSGQDQDPGGVVGFFSNLDDLVGRGMFSWVLGWQSVSTSTITYNMAGDSVGVFWAFTAKNAVANHHVVLYSAQEDDPGNPWGWLDLSALVKSALDGLF